LIVGIWCVPAGTGVVRVKGRSAMLAKALLGARSQLLNMSLALENQIRGILKTFGRIVPRGRRTVR
jgi:transposase